MALAHARSGEVIQLPLGAGLGTSRSATLVKTDELELIRLVLPAGKVIPIHKAPGEITIQCLEGRVALSVVPAVAELVPGQLLYLSAGQPHAVTAIEPSTLLVTLVLSHARTDHKLDPVPKLDVVQQASEESFPASDAPAWFIRS